MRPVARLLIFLMVASTAISPQTPTFTLRGQVTGPGGESLPGVTVRASNQGNIYEATTDSNGNYTIQLPGTGASYDIHAELPGFGPEDITGIAITGNRTINVTLLYASLVGEEITVTSVGDAASGRPQYLPNSELARGTIFTAYGKFSGVPTTLTTASPWLLTLGGLSADIDGPNTAPKPMRLYFVNPNQFSGAIPSDTELGPNTITVHVGGKDSRPIPVFVVETKPTFFTLRQTGSGPLVVTDLNYNVITEANPASANQDIVIWGNNWGASPADGAIAVRDTRGDASEFQVTLGGNVVSPNQISFAGIAGANFGQMNLNLGSNPATGCNVPFQVRVRDKSGAFFFSNPGTIPIRKPGEVTCSDNYGFGASQIQTFAQGGSYKVGTFSMSENINVTATGNTLRLTTNWAARIWNRNSFDAPPALGTCLYSWEPWKFVNPFTPQPIPFTGDATFRTQFALFTFTSANASQIYSFPSQFTEGAFTAIYTNTFAVGGTPFQNTLNGTYTRTTGLASTSAINLVTRTGSNDFHGSIFTPLRNGLPRGPFGGTFFELQLQAQDHTRGRHLIRCHGDPTTEGLFANMDGLLAMMPNRPNQLDAAARFLARQPLQYPHPAGSALDRTDVVFDANLFYLGLDTVR